ncbi:hypothetical protein JCM14469_34680 [Desulfatiferula olefinivorans]
MKRWIRPLLPAVLGLMILGCAGKTNKENGMNDQRVFERLGGLTVKTMDGQDIVMTSLWAERRVALVFLRHYG